MANLHFRVDLSKVKLLKAIETCTKKWGLLCSCRPWSGKISIAPVEFDYLCDFDTFEELKVWCDLNMPGITLVIETYDDWLSQRYELTKS